MSITRSDTAAESRNNDGRGHIHTRCESTKKICIIIVQTHKKTIINTFSDKIAYVFRQDCISADKI